MPLTKEQLLIPRYMCTGTPMEPIWPGSIWRGGDIIEESKLHGGLMYCDTNGPKYSDFPHLFRPMPWWEGRRLDDMPLYLKCGNDGKVRKVIRYYLCYERCVVVFDGGRERTLNEKWVPCDEQEYLDYQNQKI